jgi:hypothetical protein
MPEVALENLYIILDFGSLDCPVTFAFGVDL